MGYRSGSLTLMKSGAVRAVDRRNRQQMDFYAPSA